LRLSQAKSFNKLVVETAESFEGMLGQINLNAAGDRIGGNYDFGSFYYNDEGLSSFSLTFFSLFLYGSFYMILKGLNLKS